MREKVRVRLRIENEMRQGISRDEFVLVYQEYAGELPARLAIRDDILRDVFPEQINHVNVATGGEVRSVTFSHDDQWRTLNLE
jgi:hypothetical protein